MCKAPNGQSWEDLKNKINNVVSDYNPYYKPDYNPEFK